MYPALLPLMRTPQLPVVDWTDASADLNGLVRFVNYKIRFLRVYHHISNELYDRLRNDDSDPSQSPDSLPVVCPTAQASKVSQAVSLSTSWRTNGRGLETIKGRETRQYAAEIRTWQLSNKIAQPEASKVSAHVRLLQVRWRTALWMFLPIGPQRFIDVLHRGCGTAQLPYCVIKLRVHE